MSNNANLHFRSSPNNSSNHTPRLDNFEIEESRGFNYQEITSENTHLNTILNFLYEHYDLIYQKFFHIYFIIVFEILFYFNYIVNIESSEVKRVLSNFAAYLGGMGIDWRIIIPSSEKHRIMYFCESIENNLIYKENAKLKQEAYSIIWGLTIAWCFLTFLHFLTYRSPKKIALNLLKSIIFISVIGLFEYYFFTKIVTHYVTIGNEQATCYLFEDILK